MTRLKLLGKVPKGNSTFYMINDTKQNSEISLEQFCYYLGKGMIENSVGYLKGVDVVISSPVFGRNPINILDIPIFKDTNTVSKLRLSKRCRQGRNIVGFYISDGKSEIYKTRQETINLIKGGLIENADISTSNGEDIIRGINGTSLDELPTVSLDTNEAKKVIDYSKFIGYIENNMVSAFVYNNIKILNQNKEENTSGNITYTFKTDKSGIVTLKLKFNNDIKNTLYIGSTEAYTKSYTNNQNSASELIKDIHEYFKSNIKDIGTVKDTKNVKVSLRKTEEPTVNKVGTAGAGVGTVSNSNVIRNNNEYLRIINNVLDTVSKEVFN